MAATDPALRIRKRAAAAAFTLLGIPPALQAASSDSTLDRWSMDTSVMRYSEAERITVVEPQIAIRRDLPENKFLNILVTVDTITGSTPLGTLPATQNTSPNTATGPSGRNDVVGKVPLSNMTDTRYALDTTWQQPVGTDYLGIFGANASKETDYIALGANTKLARDFNQKNTTLSFGVAPEFDISNPNGGKPSAFATVGTPGAIDGTRDTKWLASAVAGLTQIVNRRVVMQLNYGYTREQGYLNDPYKEISVFNPAGDPVSAIYEKRPRDRNEQNIYWMTKYNIWNQDVFSLGMRFYWDDWGIHSQTLDFAFRRQSTKHFYWQPHVRYYHQTAADFYHIGVPVGPLPDFASSDLRLSEINAVTFGLQVGYTFQDESFLVVRAEIYTQSGDNHPKEAVGAQRSFDLSPDLNATILQLDYHFEPSRFFR